MGATRSRCWYNKGGMHVVHRGMCATALFALLARPLLDVPYAAWCFVCVLCAGVTIGLRTSPKDVFVGVLMPINWCSLLLVLLLPMPPLILGIAFLVAAIKVGVCMSVCLHRYAAHSAFKCGPRINVALGVLGCLANQGGPIWWASQHRVHHKFCDEPRDPHSSKQVGALKAFTFFDSHETVEEEFAPVHIDSPLMRHVDTWSFVPHIIELCVSYSLAGLPGLFVAYCSAWMCLTITLWFNIVNHPSVMDAKCKASDERVLVAPNVFFFLLSQFMFYAHLSGEDGHRHHHTHAQLAQRPGLDPPYYLFVKPLVAAGLIWDCKI
jgi:fatty-acid desaturase